MMAFHGHETTAMLQAYNFSTPGCQLIGGGNGSLLGSVLQRYPELTEILFDPSDRCSILEGSFEPRAPPAAMPSSQAIDYISD
jgi:hypothetical protein